MSSVSNSTTWHKVSDIRPRLHDHISYHRHEYRHQAWFVLLDKHKSRAHRFNAMSWFFISCMNGQRTLQELYEITCTRFSDSPPSQDDIIQLIGKLYLSELIHTDVTPNIEELSQRGTSTITTKIQQYLLNPLSLRFSLFNPDTLLQKAVPFVGKIFNKKLFYGWLGLVSISLLLAIINWPELSNSTRLHAFSTQNIVLLLLLYPLIKFIHELGHAFAIKHFGGEVNEMGIMLMVFVPIPYVNAYNAVAFTNKQQRMTVSAMGIMIETTLASLALMVWLNTEPGLLHSICFDVILIGGLSTLLINGNPLLKFDGYYILADWLETPNLAVRSKKYLSSRLQSWLFRIEKPDNGLNVENERYLFLPYAIASLVYRLLITLFIIGLLLDMFLLPGILLATWVLGIQYGLPLIKYIHFMATSEQVSQNRTRIYTVTGTAVFVLLISLFVIPVSQTSTTQGIIWLSEEMQLKSNAPGFIRNITVENNSDVHKNQIIARIDNPHISGKVKVLKSKLRELQIQLNSKRGDHLETEKLKQEIETIELEIDQQQERLASLRLRSPASGRLVIPDLSDLPDQFVQQGQTIGFILEPDYVVAQVVISERDIALFQQTTSEFEIRPFGHANKTWPATFKRLIPEALEQLPSAALGIMGGGKVLVDPDDPAGLKTLEKVFQIELSIPGHAFANFIGNRVHVRVRHHKQPLAWQWGRSLKQLLLGRINV